MFLNILHTALKIDIFMRATMMFLLVLCILYDERDSLSFFVLLKIF